jgi:hypothetical protein
MSRTEHEMWQTNIENAASRVAAEYGSAAVNSVFARYDAHGFHDLSSCYFSEVFADLEMMANDN